MVHNVQTRIWRDKDKRGLYHSGREETNASASGNGGGGGALNNASGIKNDTRKNPNCGGGSGGGGGSHVSHANGSAAAAASVSLTVNHDNRNDTNGGGDGGSGGDDADARDEPGPSPLSQERTGGEGRALIPDFSNGKGGLHAGSHYGQAARGGGEGGGPAARATQISGMLSSAGNDAAWEAKEVEEERRSAVERLRDLQLPQQSVL